MIGDSVTAESCCTSDASHTVPYVLRHLLASYGNYGTGIVPLFLDYSVTLRPEWTLNQGTLSTVCDFGPAQSGDFCSTAAISGTTSVTFNPSVSGNKLIVYGEQTTDSTGCSVSIDGATATVVGNQTSASAATFSAAISVTLSSLHTVNISATSGGKCYLYGAQWLTGASTGLAVSDVGRGFARSAAFGTSAVTQLAYLKALSPSPQIAVVALGVNDVYESPTTATQYQAQMQAIISQLLELNPKMHILILDEENFSGTPLASLTQTQVQQIERELAQRDGMTYTSVSDLWGSYSQALAKGLCVTGGHPSDSGAASIASLIDNQIEPILRWINISR